tara:strand:- start:628 stop:804 length:177 start_codon:yes stop_codon:yes gene_type:complete
MPKPGNKGFLFSVNIETHKEFKINCYQDSQDMSVLVERFIEAYNRQTEVARKKNTLDG